MFKVNFKKLSAASAVVLLSSLGTSAPASAGLEPFVGEIAMVGFNFAPRGWASCNGQLLPIAQNAALFSLLGTTYGGDGRQTFALPDLRGRVAIHMGQGPGLSNYRIGQRGGNEMTTLAVAHLPSHNHNATTTVNNIEVTLNGTNAAGNEATPGGNSIASKSRTNIYSTNAPDVAMHANSATATATATTTVSNTGAGLPFSNKIPYLTVNYVIALYGVFPSRN